MQSIRVMLEIGEAVGSEVTKSHFGLNFVADYERIGNRRGETFDETYLLSGSAGIRYPGGITAERLIDIKNPNQQNVVDENGVQRPLASLATFMEFARVSRADPTVIIPTAQLLTTTSTSGHRSFNEAMRADLKNYVLEALRLAPANSQLSIEIGNEYEAWMTSREYGRVASRVAEIIEATVTEFRTAGGSLALDPKVFVQAWGYSANGSLSNADLAARNQSVLAQFSSSALSAIDGVVSHIYYSEGRGQSIAGLGAEIASIASLHTAWANATRRELVSRVSEWNVQHQSTESHGLKQSLAMIEMFATFLEQNFDMLDFWSAQFHATSVASNTGKLQVAGALLNFLSDELIGARPMKLSGSQSNIIVNGFRDDTKLTYLLTSSSTDQLVASLNELPPSYMLESAKVFGIDATSADGTYKSLTGLHPYLEPDATPVFETLEPALVVKYGAVLDPFETLILVYERQGEFGLSTIDGTSNADLIIAGSVPSYYFGGGGFDTVSYELRRSSVVINMDFIVGSVGPVDRFDSIEAIKGTKGSDWISGTSFANTLDGDHGNDTLFGGDGSDRLNGGAGSDQLTGGRGDDVIDGGPGDDLQLSDAGADTILGGEGRDVLSFEGRVASVNVFAASNSVETTDGIVSFSNIETFVGTSGNDRFVGGISAGYFSGLSGNDQFVTVSDRDTIDGGSGDDFLLAFGQELLVLMGDGDDSCFIAGSGIVKVGAGSDFVHLRGRDFLVDLSDGDDTFIASSGSDTFIFAPDSGDDTIRLFDPSIDWFAIGDPSGIEVRTLQTDLGTKVLFGDRDSVLLIGVTVGLEDLLLL